jgi:hypothetical protein
MTITPGVHVVCGGCVQITVDGDTSTNDTVIGLASGAAGNAPISDPGSAEGKQLQAALTALLQVGGWGGKGAGAAAGRRSGDRPLSGLQ